jgi:predicted PurR-regulated permease PerM
MAPHRAAERRQDLTRYLQKLLITVAVVALAFLAFRWLQVFLLAFGATLVAVLLRAVANPIRRRTPLNAAWSLAAAVLLLLALIGLSALFVRAQVVAQFDQLSEVLPRAWVAAQAELSTFPVGRWMLGKLQEAQNDHSVVSSLGVVAGRLGRITRVGVGAAADLVLVIVAGVYFAAQPSLYRDGLLRLFPEGARDRLTLAVDEVGQSLRRWLVGTGLAMIAMGVLIAAGAAALGLPAPLALGLLAGLAEFVPIVGAIISAIPGLLLAGAQDAQTLVYTLVFYVAAHQFEGHVLIPLIQRQVVAVPPALTLFSILAFGLLFGPLGVILATPLAVVVIVLVRRLYLNEAADVVGR